MRLHYDERSDALYLRLDDSPIEESDEVQPGVVLDVNDAGQVVGVEILGLNARVPLANLKQIQFDSPDYTQASQGIHDYIRDHLAEIRGPRPIR